MGRLPIKIPDDLEEKFRKEVGRRFGAKKGSLKKAIMEAIELWVKESKT
jgi:hypothetical protein